MLQIFLDIQETCRRQSFLGRQTSSSDSQSVKPTDASGSIFRPLLPTLCSVFTLCSWGEGRAGYILSCLCLPLKQAGQRFHEPAASLLSLSQQSPPPFFWGSMSIWLPTLLVHVGILLFFHACSMYQTVSGCQTLHMCLRTSPQI